MFCIRSITLVQLHHVRAGWLRGQVALPPVRLGLYTPCKERRYASFDLLEGS